MPRLILAMLLMLAPSAALAQSAQCRMPATLPRPKAEGPTAKEPKKENEKPLTQGSGISKNQ